jgi:urea transport system ATP-binding protein
MVVSEQVLSFTHEIADRFLIMERGELVYEATKHDVDESRIHSYLTV